MMHLERTGNKSKQEQFTDSRPKQTHHRRKKLRWAKKTHQKNQRHIHGVGVGAKYNSFTVELALALQKQNSGRRWTNGPDEGGLMDHCLLHCFTASLLHFGWLSLEITKLRHRVTRREQIGAFSCRKLPKLLRSRVQGGQEVSQVGRGCVRVSTARDRRHEEDHQYAYHGSPDRWSQQLQ